MPRKEFRTLISLDDARGIAATLIPPRRIERVPIASASGRVLAEDVVSPADVPPFTRCMMDGFAVRAADTAHADEERPIPLARVAVAEAGRPAGVFVGPGEAVEVATGALLPGGANAVVKVEHAELADGRVLVHRGVAPGENVMSAGDDLMLGDTVLPAGTRLAPAQIGVLAAAGQTEVTVWAAPRVAVVSIGDELRPAGSPLEPGTIHDINGVFLAAAVERSGGRPSPLGIVPDDRALIEETLTRAAATAELVLTSGSTSAGAGDVVYRILEERGELLAHGIRIEPGKPTALARLGGTPVVALPGNPASAAVVFESLVAPLLRQAAGLDPDPPRRRVQATLATEIRGSPGRRLLRMVGVVGRGETARAYPIEHRSGAISLLAEADGYLDVPENVARVRSGARVEVVLFEDRGALPDALFMGSHCLALRPLFRLLAPILARSVHVGSLGGVRAVSRGIADAAGIHLREPGGEYNVPALERLAVAGAALVRGYRRMQGWIVAAGNPARVSGLGDVVDGGLRLLNRVGGSGTRVLLDELVAAEAGRRGESSAALAERLRGFDVEATSHSAVAAAVRDGTADVGLGIEAAAALNGLGFVPVAEESFDFLVDAEALEREIGQALRSALRSAAFRDALKRLAGYREEPDAGEVIWRSRLA